MKNKSKELLNSRNEIAGNKKAIADMEVKWDAKFKLLSEKFYIADQYSRKNNLLLKRYLPKHYSSQV